jgi:hypothetical protein
MLLRHNGYSFGFVPLLPHPLTTVAEDVATLLGALHKVAVDGGSVDELGSNGMLGDRLR